MHTNRLKKRIGFADGAVCVAALLIGYQLSSTAPEESSAGASIESTDASTEAPASAEAPPAIARAHGTPDAPPIANEQLAAPYRLDTDKDGKLLISSDIREIFDHFLALGSAGPIESTAARIKAHMQKQLHEPALSEALSLLDRYMAMRTALSEMEQISPQTKSDTDSMNAWMIQRNELMRNYLGDAYEPFFGAEHRHDEYTMEKLDILRNPTLDDAGKQQEIEKMTATRFPDIQQTEQKAQAHLQLARNEQELVKNGATEADIYNHRLAEFGPAVAERLQALDKRRSEWQQRVTDWQSQRNNILKYDGLSDEDKERELQSLADKMFTKNEQRRLGSL